MKLKVKILVVGSAVLFVGCATSHLNSRAPAEAAPADSPDVATIINSGSFNSPAWTITVPASGDASIAVLKVEKSFTLAGNLTSRFFADLVSAKANGPASPVNCIKSASFGTRTTVTSGGWTFSDLSCPLDKNSPLAALAMDIQNIEQSANLNTVIQDIKNPVHQQPANLPHCLTPDGFYSVTINVAVHDRYFAFIKDLRTPEAGQNEGPWDIYDVSGASPFNGSGSHNNRFSSGEVFSLSLLNPNYDKDTDASLKATLVDQRTNNDGSPLNTPPVSLAYDHLNCTRWYR